MKISKIRIENFRSIKFASFSVGDFNIYVGQNNCGKTNFFEAIEFFFNGVNKSSGGINNLKHKKDDSLQISVEIEFSDAQDGVDKMSNTKNQTVMRDSLNGVNIISFKRVDSNKRIMIINGKETKPGTGFDAALNDFLPKFEYINTKQYYDAVAKYAKGTPIGIMLSGVLSVILEENVQYKAFQQKFKELFENEDSAVKAEFDKMGNSVKVHLEKQFPDCSKVMFEVSVPLFEDLLKNFYTSIDDGIETLAEEKGDGMQRALMLAIIQAYADFRKSHEDINKSFLFYIDEAELHLHPTAQRNLKEVLYLLSQGMDQVFINTHSSVFLADDHEQQKIFKVEKHSGETSINEINRLEKPYVVYDLLGGSPADLLLPRNFLVVEGQSEFELLTGVIKNYYSDKPAIQIIKACGDIKQVERTINSIEKIFIPLNASIFRDRVILLLDAPSTEVEGGFKQFRKNYKHLDENNQIFVLDKRDLEQCYPNQYCPTYINWKKTQAEVDLMDGHKKKQLAKHVGGNITKDQFESDLQICYQALCRSWELSY